MWRTVAEHEELRKGFMIQKKTKNIWIMMPKVNMYFHLHLKELWRNIPKGEAGFLILKQQKKSENEIQILFDCFISTQKKKKYQSIFWHRKWFVEIWLKFLYFYSQFPFFFFSNPELKEARHLLMTSHSWISCQCLELFF